MEPLRQLCVSAGAAILSHYHSEQADAHEAKADNSPLTAADLASHTILVEGLASFGLPVLSEESSSEELHSRRQWQRFWMVDPLDGTREFLERTGEFTINIALIENNCPVFGFITVPLQETAYAGVPGEGAWRYADGSWQAIHCRALQESEPLVVLTSRRHRGEKLDACLELIGGHKGGIHRDLIGSALKFCLLAEGRGDFYPRFSPCSEWDTAAGQALLEGAGGALLGLDGKPLTYNARDSLLNPHFLATAEPGNPLFRLLDTLESSAE